MIVSNQLSKSEIENFFFEYGFKVKFDFDKYELHYMTDDVHNTIVAWCKADCEINMFRLLYVKAKEYLRTGTVNAMAFLANYATIDGNALDEDLVDTDSDRLFKKIGDIAKHLMDQCDGVTYGVMTEYFFCINSVSIRRYEDGEVKETYIFKDGKLNQEFREYVAKSNEDDN